MRCANCAHDNSSSARFCASCGKSLQHPCPGCGAGVLAGQMFCIACGHSVGAPAEVPPTEASRPPREPQATPATEAGERRHATVMFSDLSGYTALNESFDPEEVEEIMGRVKREAWMLISRSNQ